MILAVCVCVCGAVSLNCSNETSHPLLASQFTECCFSSFTQGFFLRQERLKFIGCEDLELLLSIFQPEVEKLLHLHNVEQLDSEYENNDITGER